MNSYKAHNKTLVHNCNKINKSIQYIREWIHILYLHFKGHYSR